MIRAVLWDVDGTLAETERDGHRVAFNRAFESLGVPWRWDERRYGELLQIAGGRERLLHDMATQSAAPAAPDEQQRLAQRVHELKNRYYVQIAASGELPLRPGVRELLDEASAASIPLAIATTTSRGNVAALLGRHLGAAWRARFAAVLCAEDAPRKKPDPQVYQLALDALRVPPQEALAIEDSPAGVAAAKAVGIPVVISRSFYFPDTDAEGAQAAGPSLADSAGWSPSPSQPRGRVSLRQLERWHAAA